MTFRIKGKDYDGILWLLDAGHGIETAGKRSPRWEDQEQLLEYEFNRNIVARAMNKVKRSYRYRSFKFINLVPELKSPSLTERARRANQIMLDNPTKYCIFVSIHGDAFTSESANGTTIYTSPGYTYTDTLAAWFETGLRQSIVDRTKSGQKITPSKLTKLTASKFNALLPKKWRFRGLKEARFGVLIKTTMPAMLWETGFYSNKEECAYMMSMRGRSEITVGFLEGVFNVEQELKGY